MPEIRTEQTPREQYPIGNARFRGGRTYHWVKDPGEHGWHGTLHAACGRTGVLATGYGLTPATQCTGCRRALDPAA
jgi:hypothetical protein